jgi:hypothetical protein
MRDVVGARRALVVGLALAVGLGLVVHAQVLSGSWETTAVAEISPIGLDIDSEIIVDYSLETWSFASDTKLDETGWTSQSFVASGTLGEFAMTTQATFAPVAPVAVFSQWTATGTVTYEGVTTIGTFTLTPGNIRAVLSLSGSIGDVSVGAVMTFGATTPVGVCDLLWQDVIMTVRYPFGCVDVTSALSVKTTGFEKFTFAVYDIAIPPLSWVTLDALLTFTPEAKTLVLTPDFDFGMDLCFEVYIGMGAGDDLLLTDFTIDGVGLTCLVGGIEFTGQTYVGDGSKPSLLTGTSYWEAYQISTTEEACCGPFEFDVTAYFGDGDQLFDLAEIVGNMSIDLGTAFTFSTGITLQLAVLPAVAEWTIGFLFEW